MSALKELFMLKTAFIGKLSLNVFKIEVTIRWGRKDMKILLCIDDTDDLEKAISTGALAEGIAAMIEKNNWGDAKKSHDINF
ncbi:hypothetical protein [Clostridium aceticum]|nr:hypothetical protein [Clostridium aceticum]